MRKILLILTLTIALVASACSSDDSWSTGEDGVARLHWFVVDLIRMNYPDP